MSIPAPFGVEPDALDTLSDLLRQHPNLQAGLDVCLNMELCDENGKVEHLIDREFFWLAHDSPEFFKGWPRIALCGKSVPVSPQALESLTGKTLTLECYDGLYEGQKLLVASKKEES